MNQFIGETVLSVDQVREGIGRIAARLNRDFTSAVVITVVPGGILATADLVRQLNFDLGMDYISCPHTPASGTTPRPSSTTRTSPRVDIPVRQYYGYEMDTDELLVGFGLPWHDQLRNLPYIARLNTSSGQAHTNAPA